MYILIKENGNILLLTYFLLSPSQHCCRARLQANCICQRWLTIKNGSREVASSRKCPETLGRARVSINLADDGRKSARCHQTLWDCWVGCCCRYLNSLKALVIGKGKVGRFKVDDTCSGGFAASAFSWCMQFLKLPTHRNHYTEHMNACSSVTPMR